jgi:uncharacterized OB-fold protein
MSTNSVKQIPCRDGLWSIPTSPDEKPQLIGSRCPNCGEIIFPVNPVCVNCQHQAMEEIKLSRKGKVYSYSTVMLPPPKWYKGKVPFDIGYVELPEGVRIWTRLLGAEAGTFKISQEVELDIDVMQVDDGGNEILGYCFIPVKK